MVKKILKLTFTIVWGLLIFLQTNRGYAQLKKDSLNLEQVLKIVQNNYPAIKAAQIKIRAEKKSLGSALDLGNTTFSYGQEKELEEHWQRRTNWTISQNDIDIFGSIAHYNARKQAIELAKAEAQLTLQEVFTEVKKAYNNYLFQQKRLSIYNKINETYKDFVRATKLRYSTEESSKLAWLAARTKYQSLQVKIKTVEGDFKMAKALMQRFLLRESDFTLIEQPSNQIDSLVIFALKDATLEVANEQIKQAEQQVKISKATLLPTFSVSYKNQRTNHFRNNYGYEVGISIPFFSKKYHQKETNKALLEKTQEEITTLRLKLKYILQQKLITLKTLQTTKEYYKNQAEPLAEERMEASNLAFKLGEIDYINYIESIESNLETLLLSAENNYKYRNVYADIQALTGTNKMIK